MADAAQKSGDAAAEDGKEESGLGSEGAAEEEEEAPPPAPPPPADLHAALREPGVHLLSWLSLVGAAGAFPTSKLTRELLSARVRVDVRFDVYTLEDLKPSTASSNRLSERRPSLQPPKPRSTGREDSETAGRRRRVQRTRARLPYTLAEGPLRMYVRVSIGEVPVRGAVLNRILGRSIPMIQWTDCGEIRVKCRGDLNALDTAMRNKIGSLSEADELEFLEGPTLFRNLQRLTLSITAVTRLQPDFSMPRVRRLKVVCRDSAFSTETLASIHRAFPGLSRLHLAVDSAGLLPLCGPGFLAPPDFRISLLVPELGGLGFGKEAGEASFFVAAHLLTLPFSWCGSLFQNVVRLQMTELSQDHAGLGTEQLASILRTLPRLRRLGTVSMRVFQLLDISREDCNLEELVLVTNMMDVAPLFRSFLFVEQAKRRTSLRRLALHLQAGDGVGRPTPEVENFLCAGWFTLATSLIRPDGMICFSFGHRQIAQTALAQLAWFQPLHFCLDWADYEEDGRLPRSTPLERPLPYFSLEEVVRPRGTLVAGSLRPAAKDEAKEALESTAPALNTPQGSGRRRSVSGGRAAGLGNSGGLSSRSPSPSPAQGRPRRMSGRASIVDLHVSVRHTFLDIPLIDAYEGMVKYKQEAV